MDTRGSLRRFEPAVRLAGMGSPSSIDGRRPGSVPARRCRPRTEHPSAAAGRRPPAPGPRGGAPRAGRETRGTTWPRRPSHSRPPGGACRDGPIRPAAGRRITQERAGVRLPYEHAPYRSVPVRRGRGRTSLAGREAHGYALPSAGPTRCGGHARRGGPWPGTRDGGTWPGRAARAPAAPATPTARSGPGGGRAVRGGGCCAGSSGPSAPSSPPRHQGRSCSRRARTRSPSLPGSSAGWRAHGGR